MQRGTTGRLPLRPARAADPEWLDIGGHDPSVLAGNLRDLRRVNRWLGGVRLTVQAIRLLAPGLRPGDRLSFLDVAAGDGDFAMAIAAWGRRRGTAVRCMATDVRREVLTSAREQHRSDIALAVADARRLAFADRSCDIVHCSLALHHMTPDEAVEMLGEMGRVARHGVIVNDLVRGWLGFAGAWALSRLLTRNPLTRHDAPLSARRAYTRPEMAALAGLAGLEVQSFRGFLGYRVAMTARRRA